MPGRIVVGVDGSHGARRALCWAIDEAAVRAAVIQAVAVWRNPVEPDALDMLWTDFGPQRTERFAAAEEDKAASIAEMRLSIAVAEIAGQDRLVDIESLVLEGDPAQTLCRLSSDADLLVVGSRGRRNFIGLVFGSLSTKCFHYCRCPLVIVPDSLVHPYDDSI
jgi:nucleotide-binding universal stress UspA family protein